MRIPMIDLQRQYAHMKADVDARIEECLRSQHWILGPQVSELEERIAAYLGSKFCIATSSGTEALVIGMRALSLARQGRDYWGDGDEIVTVPFTFAATADTIVRSGARPVFVDIERESFSIDLSKLAACLAARPRVRALVPVHLYGRPADMTGIAELARRHGVAVVEDAAQAFGAVSAGRRCASIGDLGALSFFPTKNLGAFGDAGMIVTDDPELARISRDLTKHGGRDKYDVSQIGYNARMDTLQAAILLARLAYVEDFNARRRRIAAAYRAQLSSLAGLSLPGGDEGHVYNQFTVRVADGRRSALQAHLAGKGIASTVYYPKCLHRMKAFQERAVVWEECPEALRAADEVLSLPIEPLLSDGEIAEVGEAVRSFFQ